MAPKTPSNPGLSAHSLTHNLSSLIEASKTRTKDAQRIFYPVATMWDTYLQFEDVRTLPAHLQKPLAKLCSEIIAITNTHFETFIKGIYSGGSAPLTTPTTTPSPGHQPTSIAPSRAFSPQIPSPEPSYASIAASTPQAQPAPTRKQRHTPAKTTSTRPDTRLFIRISPTHPAREAGSFAVLTGLKNALGTNAPLLKEVLAVPSGYALCTKSLEDLDALEQHTALLTNTIFNCQIERP